MINHRQKGIALHLIDTKLEGQKRQDARKFVRAPGRVSSDLYNLCKALDALPDLDPDETREQRSRMNVPPELRKRRKKLDPEQREQLCADRATGMGYVDLAKKYGVAYATAYDIAHYVEVPPELQRQRNITAAQRKQVCDDRAMGMTFAEISHRHGIHRSTAERIARNVKITPQPGYDSKGNPIRKESPMATRQAESKALAKRCEDVGWEVENTPKGIKVRNPDGVTKIIHLSFSDVNALEACERDLNRLGLADAEETVRTKRSGARLRALATDRKRNTARTEQLTAAQKKQQKDLLLKASGPYLGEPEEVPLSWFTEKHPAPWMRWVWMTPELARYLLKHHNKPGGAGEIGTNRPQSEVQIRHYRDIIVSNQWHLTHQGMASDTTGMVQDGQHRMAAVDAAAELVPDVRVPVAYFVGMDPANFKAIDEGLVRTASQLFAMGGERNGSNLRSALRLIIAFKDGDEGARNRWRLRNTNAQLLDAFARDPETLRTAARAAASNASKVPMSGGAFTALQYLLYTANGADNRFVEAFLHGIAHGTMISNTRMKLITDDPRESLRRTLQSFKDKKEGRPAQGMDQLGLGILAWNFMVQGRHRQNLRWVKGTEVPQVLICKDGVGAIPPRALTGEVSILTEDVGTGADE